jgi:hypothetical protein
MNGKLDSIPKILGGDKTIESRWYLSRKAPWGKILKGDIVYFKNTGEAICASAVVRRVLEFSDLNCQKVREIIRDYGGEGKISIGDVRQTIERCKNKKYCILVFLEKARKVRPFEIDKKGFGISSAWLCVGKIKKIKRVF